MKNLTINVGDYARSYDGYIAKCERFYSYDDFIHFDRDIIDTYCEPTNYFDKKDIKKYIKAVSPNIIDLIEVGDILSFKDGSICRVCGIEDDYYLLVDCSGISYWEKNVWIDDFESIVTKEQMEAMEYKIER